MAPNRVVGPSTLLAPINVASSNSSNLLFPTAPLTPPLTPPCTNEIPLPSVIQPPKPAPPPPTLASRVLINYPLHPLFAAQYAIHEELGCGGFGFVVRAVRHADQSSVAVKFIEKAKIPSHGWVISRSFSPASGVAAKEDGQRLLPMEAYILGYVRNIPGVVRYIDLFEDSRYFYLVMEHHGSPWQSPEKETAPIPIPQPTFTPQQTATPASSPTFLPASSPMELSPPRPVLMARRSSCDLFECIEQHSRFSEETARDVFAQVVEVVYQLGKMGICHRDIKDENIVVSADFKVKLIDFGSAVLFHPEKPLPTYSRFYGTTSFASAEILRGEPYHAPPSEVWSLGVLLSILVTGEVPFADQDAAKVGRMSGPRFPISPEVQDLMRRCLIVDPSRRINISQIRRHPWLAQGAKSA
ncbi:Pkinase-domain-containing protein [Meredithblackwellia eburnea MCA 4105]